MAVAVIRIGIRHRGVAAIEGVTHEVPAGDHPRGREHGAVGARGAVAAQGRVVVIDARVHHGNLDAGAAIAECVLHDVGAGQCDRADQVGIRSHHGVELGTLDRLDGPHGLDARHARKRCALRRADADRIAVEQRVVGTADRELDTGICGCAQEPRLLGTDGVQAVAVGDGLARQLDEIQVGIFGVARRNGFLRAGRREAQRQHECAAHRGRD